MDTAVYRKNSNTNVYLNWSSFGLNSWNWGTLKTILTRAFENCSTNVSKQGNRIYQGSTLSPK